MKNENEIWKRQQKGIKVKYYFDLLKCDLWYSQEEEIERVSWAWILRRGFLCMRGWFECWRNFIFNHSLSLVSFSIFWRKLVKRKKDLDLLLEDRQQGIGSARGTKLLQFSASVGCQVLFFLLFILC